MAERIGEKTRYKKNEKKSLDNWRNSIYQSVHKTNYDTEFSPEFLCYLDW